jgi:hypothetical protein
MIFYVSCRPIKIENKMYSPKEHFKNCFVGLNVTFKLVANNLKTDGRWLYEINISDNYTQAERDTFKAVMLEGLQLFSVHEKTLASAETLAELLTDRAWTINGAVIEIVPL